MSSKLRIAGLVSESVVDGPGLRFVIFTQGCPHSCVGCHNPHTHDPLGGTEISVDEILKKILETKLISGITFSGGEPFIQAKACAELAKLVKTHRPELNIWAYSGYYYQDLLTKSQHDPDISNFLQAIDTLIDGPYDHTKRTFDLPFRGSSNQIIYPLNTSK